MKGKSIAILYSGRVQCYDHVSKRTINNFIDPLKEAGYNVNMFGSFWDETNVEEFIHTYDPYFKVYEIETLSKYTGGVIKNFNEYTRLIKKLNIQEESVLANTMYWIYKLNRAYYLSKQYEHVNNMQHDYYVRMRPDTTLTNRFQTDDLDKLTDTSIMLHVDRIVDLNGIMCGYRNGWVDDNFCIAKKNPFDLYCSIYDNLIEWVNKYQSCIPHVIFQHLFQEKNIQTVMPNSPMLMVKDNGIKTDSVLLFTHCYPELDIQKYIKDLFG